MHDLDGPPGMDDYEFYLTIKKSGKDKLIVALLE